MSARRRWSQCIWTVLILAGCGVEGPGAADLVLTGGTVWTGVEGAPRAEAVAVSGGRIVAVGTNAEIAERVGPETRELSLAGRFVGPGFIDNHTHFARAGELLLGVNLLDVADVDALRLRVSEAASRLPDGSWMIGGDWGAYEAFALGSTGREGAPSDERFRPDRSQIDDLTTDNPALLSKWDRSEWLANSLALRAAGADCTWTGVECAAGSPTGRLTPDAAGRIRDAVPPKPMDQKLAEARVGLERLARHGVTSFHDNTAPDQFEVYERLRESGGLTSRVYARPTLDRWPELVAAGQRMGTGDEWIRIGGLKGFVDGIMGNSSARFYEPYLTSGELGIWRDMMQDEPGMFPLLLGADTAGFWPQVHAIGDHAIDTLLHMFERVIEENGPRERRSRVIHTQVMRGPEVAERMARIGAIAEVQPYHAIDDMRWMEPRIGERSRWAYAFRTLEEAGVLLSFGSDWPGTNAAWYTSNPMHGVYAAVTRQTLDGEPPGGWFPEERIQVESALRAYTANNAWAAGEEADKGTVEVGKLADLVVLERDPTSIPPAELKDVRVDYTIVGGRIVFEREGPE